MTKKQKQGLAEKIVADGKLVESLKGQKLGVVEITALAAKAIEVYSTAKALSSADKLAVGKLVADILLKAAGQSDPNSTVGTISNIVSAVNTIFGHKWPFGK